MKDLEELIKPLAGTDWWRLGSGDGVPVVKVTDGPAGARGELFAGGPRSVSFPCGAAMGATWDVELIGRVGDALAAEAIAKGAHVLLAPTINLQRTPLGGRHFECFSEDPILTARLAVAYVTGLQRRGVSACVKHLVANDAEVDRFEISSEVDPRTLRECLLLPFEHALRGAGAWSVMAAYNRINGERATEHRHILTQILREEWGWDGVVISDWYATRSCVPSALAGMDVEMPGPPMHYGQSLIDAVDKGEVDRSVVQTMVDRVRLLADRTRATDRVAAPDGTGGAAGQVEVARELARRSLVLLRNENVLPFDASTLGTVAVIGPNANREVTQGGGSARVTATEVVTVLDGFVTALGVDRVTYAPGCRNDKGTPSIDGRSLRRADGSAGADIEVLDGTGSVRLHLAPREFRAVFLAEPYPGAKDDRWSLRATSTYTATVTGAHRFQVRTNVDAELTVGGQPVEDMIDLVSGESYDVVVNGTPSAQTVWRASLELRCEPPQSSDPIGDAVVVARGADAAVVVIGLDHEWETEGNDRDDLELPGDQVALVREVAAAQPNTVVVVLAGSPVDLSWADDVPALLWAWYPGQEGGTAIASVLLGEHDPAGRLPCTMPKRLEDTPAYLDVPPQPGFLRYGEGVFLGHRWYDARDVAPAFPFGFGLSYTSFSMLAASDAIAIDPAKPFAIVVEVANTGDRAGTETVQVYLRTRPGPGRHPVSTLVGFAKADLDLGASATVSIELTIRDLAWWDAKADQWRADAGDYTFAIGSSSRDLPLTVTARLEANWRALPGDPLGPSGGQPTRDA